MASVNLTDQVPKRLGYHHGAGLEWVQVNHILFLLCPNSAYYTVRARKH